MNESVDLHNLDEGARALVQRLLAYSGERDRRFR